jgi:tetratricopeptide (TPR) repeat protein
LALQCGAGQWKAGGVGKEADAAYALCEQALAIDPNNVRALMGSGLKFFMLAMRASPHDRSLFYWYGGKAVANFGLKRYDQPIEQARQTIAINANYVPWAHVILVAALTLTGPDAEAREALQRYLALPLTGPLKTIGAWKAYDESQHGTPRYVEMHERMYDSLRKAGMPEE